jgi:hypothetical protein
MVVWVSKLVLVVEPQVIAQFGIGGSYFMEDSFWRRVTKKLGK